MQQASLSDELSSPTTTHRSLQSPSLEAAPAWPTGQLSPAQSIKVLCTAGGRFSSSTEAPGSGRLSYHAGHTRLISLPADCTYPDLLAVLTGKHWSSSSSVRQLAPEDMPVIRYPLPSQPDATVDLVDTEDVQLMLEEFREQQAQGGGAARLHLYVEWPQASSEGAASPAGPGAPAPAPALARGGQHRSVPSSQGRRSLGNSFSSGDEDEARNTGASTLRHAGSPPQHTAKLQVIPTAVLRLLSIQGTGTFGDTYRGVWHDSTDVAVKCWGRGAVGMQCATPETWEDFAKAASQLGGYRHPNLVQVYGLLLPECTEEPGEGSIGEGATQAAAAAGGPGPEPAESQGGVAVQPASPQQPEQEGNGSAAAPPVPALPGGRQAEHMRCIPPSNGQTSQPGGGTELGREPQREPLSAQPSGLDQLPLHLGRFGSGGLLPQGIPLHTPALVMEYVPCLSLRHLLERGAGAKQLSPSACFIYARDVAKAMEYLHSKGVVHLDLKSGNVLLSWQGPKPLAKVAAWGMLPVKLAACFSPGMAFRRSWWPWLAPEVFRDPTHISEKVDVYAFAIIMWELWAQRKPYEAEGWDQMELLSSSFAPTHVRPALPGSCEGVPARPQPAPGWRELMERSWAEDPAARPSFRDILRELRDMGKELKERIRRRRRQQVCANGEPPDLPKPSSP